MRQLRILGFLGCALLFACGDDTSTGGAGGEGANGGSDTGGAPSGGGGGTAQGAGNQGGDPQGGSAQGGSAQGGSAQGGSAQGGSAQGGSAQGGSAQGGSGGDGGQGGSGGPGPNGAACADDSECLGGLCLSEALTGLPGGMCSEDCTASGTCAAGSSCADVSGDGSFAVCFRDCDPATAGSCGMPDTLSCLAVNGAPQGGICFGECADTSECTEAGFTCHANGVCGSEVCDNTADDDSDGDIDCADSECSNEANCTLDCSSAPVIQATNTGDTTSGTAFVDSDCTQVPSGNEVVYTYMPAQNGRISLVLDSATDQGIHVRTACNDATSEVACVDASIGGTDELLENVPVFANQPVFIFVDAYGPGDEGPFSLTFTFTPAPPEACTGFVDEDLDGLFDCADPTTCQGTAACTPGAGALNAPCTANTNCASVAGNDPACVDWHLGVAFNFCSEWCDVAANDCPAGALCLDVANGEGICLDQCAMDADCPTDFVCNTQGGFCIPDFTTVWTCNPDYYGDGDCDCGCGAVDVDCADNLVASCEYCNDTGSCNTAGCPGTINPTDNATCTP